MYHFYQTLCTPPRIHRLFRIMKLTTLLITIAVLQVSAATFAQKVNLTQKNATLTQLFQAIHKQTGYNVLWSASKIAGAKTVDVDFKNTPLTEALNKILENQPFTYEIDGNNIIIKEKPAPVPNVQPAAPSITVTGKVTDELGNPMIGVTVRQKGTNNVTATDAKGIYTLTVPDDKTVLVFSSIGYETQELTAKDIPAGSTITLKASQTALSEVQVLNKGYYFEKRELTTGSIGVVSSKNLEEQPTTDPLLALEGQVAGLNIQQSSGISGSYSVVRIRGVNSIANGTAPLFIIDGMPYNNQSLSSNLFTNALGLGNPGAPSQIGTTLAASGQSPFSGLNLGDIENIEVLKDADATAIYGSRGANGVILITTKKGKAGDTKVNMGISQGIGQVPHFIDLLNTQQYLQMRREAFTNSGLAIPSIAINTSDNNYDINGFWDTTRNTNWQKVLIGNTAHYTKAQASVSGGNANTQFLISGAYNRQTSVYPGDFNDETASLHLALTHSSNDNRFHIALTANYLNDNNNLSQFDFTNDITFAPDAPALKGGDGNINWQYRNSSATFGNNPIAQTLRTSSSVSNNLFSNLDLNYEILPGLILKSTFGYNHNEMSQNFLTPASSYAAPHNTDPNYRTSNLSSTIFQTWIIEPQLSYRKKILNGILNLLVGTTFQQNLQQNSEYAAGGFSSDALINDIAAGSIQIISPETYTQYRYTSLYGRISYDWDEKYLLNITGRRDGSSRFGPNREFGNFGAIGTGWIFTKEKFLSGAASWLNFGKIRVSYGTTGNDQLTDYQYLSTYSVNSTSYLGISGLTPSRLTNPYYAWEVIKKLEFGLDLGLLNDRIDISADYYRDRTDNQLVGYPLSSVTGFTTVQYNLPAVIQNTGLEAQLTTVNFKTKNFTWTSSINFTLPNNKLVSYPGLAGSSYKTTYAIGQSLFIREWYQYKGVNPQTGLYTVATANANGTPSSPIDLVITPPVTQKYYGGIANNFSYKNFGLDIFVRFVKQLGFGYQTYFGVPGIANSNEPTAVLNAWTKPGDISNIQAYTASNTTSYAFFGRSTGNITDASFIRLQNASFYYKLPASWQRSMHMSNARVYLQGQNLFTITSYIGLDPETQGLVLPPLRVIMAGISASF